MKNEVFVCREVHFCAAHRLHNPAKSDEWNREVYGLCNSPNWHGHNYRLEITVAGVPDRDTGYVIDLGLLKRLAHEHVVKHCDHRNLNLEVAFLEGILPSTENLSIAIWNQLEPHLRPHLGAGRLYSIRLCETERNSVEYFGPNSR